MPKALRAPKLSIAPSVASSRSYVEFRDHFLKEGCRRCPLCEGRTQLVPDRGNPEAKILFIGEAPGAEEDKAGRSFVGRSGKLLDKLMESIGLDTNRDVLITNVVKCRPPDNRVPTATEALACAPYLKKQIALLEPSLIVLLGATAFRRMAPDRDFGAEVGKIFDLSWEGRRIPCLPLFHPAYLLYDPRKRETMAGYLATLNKFVRENALIGNSR